MIAKISTVCQFDRTVTAKWQVDVAIRLITLNGQFDRINKPRCQFDLTILLHCQFNLRNTSNCQFGFKIRLKCHFNPTRLDFSLI